MSDIQLGSIRESGRLLMSARPLSVVPLHFCVACERRPGLGPAPERPARARAGSNRAAQRSEDMASEGEDSRRFYLQYFFPPSSVGETGRQGAPGRREIGHGALAERALAPIIPDEARPRAPAARRHSAAEQAGRPWLALFAGVAETLAPAAALKAP